METTDFSRARIDAMINLSDPLAVLATRLALDRIEAATLAKSEREDRAGGVLEGQDMFGATQVLEGAGVSNAGRPKLPIRLMVSRLGCGRDGDFSPPPAQTRTCGAIAYRSCLELWREAFLRIRMQHPFPREVACDDSRKS